MKLKIKKITLEKEIKQEIVDGFNEDTIKNFLEYIREHMANANVLINSRMDDMEPLKLYEALKKVFDIFLEPEDYLKILSFMQKIHYSYFITIKTNMMENGQNIYYYGAATNKVKYFDNASLDLKTIRKITNSLEFLVLETIKKNEKPKYIEKRENHQFMCLDPRKADIDENSELFPFILLLLSKEICFKDVLYELKWYVKEIIYQARTITDLKESEDEKIKAIGIKFDDALNRAFNDREIPKREKIRVRKHKKLKYKSSLK